MTAHILDQSFILNGRKMVDRDRVFRVVKKDTGEFLGYAMEISRFVDDEEVIHANFFCEVEDLTAEDLVNASTKVV